MRSGSWLTSSWAALSIACTPPSGPVSSGVSPLQAARASASLNVVSAPPRAVAVPAPDPQSPFRKIAPAGFRVMTWQRRVWLGSQDDGLAFFELRGDRFVRDDALRRGMQSCDGEVPGYIVETQPDSRWFVEDLHPWSACPPPHSYLRRYQSGVWTRHNELHVHWLGMATFKNGATLVAEVPYRAGPPWGYTLRVLGSALAPTPRRAPKGCDPGCYTEVDWPIALFSSSDGEALVRTDSSLMRRDSAGSWSHIPLPSDTGEVLALDGASNEDLWLTTEGGVYATRALPPLDVSPRECSDAERVGVEAAASEARRAGGSKVDPKRGAPSQVGCR